MIPRRWKGGKKEETSNGRAFYRGGA